jgi:hypothetical protein
MAAKPRDQKGAPRRKFQAKLGTELHDLFFEVPFDVKKEFGRARPPVSVTINGYRYRSTVSVYGGRYYVPVRREHREAAGLRTGDVLDIVLELDAEPRVVEAPAELAAALAKNATARKAWEKLSYSHRKEHADAILEAKKPETRERRVRKAIEMLVGADRARTRA